MSYTENDILLHVGPRALEAGRVYQRQRRVTSFENHGDGAMTATVQGNERRPYRQDISVARRATGQIVIESDCSCPVGENCKHVAAALLEGLARASNAFRPPQRIGRSSTPSRAVASTRAGTAAATRLLAQFAGRSPRARHGRLSPRASRSASSMCWRRRQTGWASQGSNSRS